MIAGSSKMILENKLVQKWKLENNVFFYKKWYLKLTFLNKKSSIINFECTILAFFDEN